MSGAGFVPNQLLGKAQSFAAALQMKLGASTATAFCRRGRQAQISYLRQGLSDRNLCEPSQVGIFLEWPQMQSWMPLPARMRGLLASMREARVADCLAALKWRR
jgi:hypothetical protein